MNKKTTAYSTLHCNGIDLKLDVPKVMGILNATPDSFFDGGKHSSLKKQLIHAAKMIEQGASIIDVGGMSSRPGAEIISEDEELKRVLPLVKQLAKNFPNTIISIDTIHANVARVCVHEGAGMINDISAGALNDQMFSVVEKLKVPYIIMHMQGTPSTMQLNPQYKNVVASVKSFLSKKKNELNKKKVKQILIDPGFGFGKTVEQNFVLLKNLKSFQSLDCPLVVGISRKSMINKTLGIKAAEALNGTTALHMLALMNGATILRTHDVNEAVETIKLYNAYQRS